MRNKEQASSKKGVTYFDPNLMTNNNMQNYSCLEFKYAFKVNCASVLPKIF